MNLYIRSSRGGRIRRGAYIYLLEYIRQDGTPITRDDIGEDHDTTHERLTLLALIEAIGRIKPERQAEVAISTDCETVNAAFRHGWLKKWEDNGYANVRNKDLWRWVETATDEHQCSIVPFDADNSYRAWMDDRLRTWRESIYDDEC